MKIIAFVRFSEILANPAGAFVAGRQGFDDYVKTVMDPERLKLRLHLFENSLLPSFAGQSITPDPSWFRLCIGTTKELPQNIRSELERIVAPYPWTKIYTNHNSIITTDEFLLDSDNKEPFNFVSLRVDDDDAVGRDSLKSLLDYASPDFSDFMISFPNGFAGKLNRKTRTIIDIARVYQPMNSVGIAYVGRYDPVQHKVISSKTSIWETGNHELADRSFKTVIDARKPMFFRTIHAGQDRRRTSYREIAGQPKADPHDLLSSVALSRAFIDPSMFDRSPVWSRLYRQNTLMLSIKKVGAAISVGAALIASYIAGSILNIQAIIAALD